MPPGRREPVNRSGHPFLTSAGTPLRRRCVFRGRSILPQAGGFNCDWMTIRQTSAAMPQTTPTIMTMPTMSSSNPALTMRSIRMCPVDQAMALGPVPAGSMKPQLAASAAGMASKIGSTPSATTSAATTGMIPLAVATLLANCRTFSLAAAAFLGDKRTGDQLGPMLAGAFALTSTKEVDYDFARRWIEDQDWGWSLTGEDEADCQKLVTHIATHRINYDIQGMRRESPIGDMITYAASQLHENHKAAVDGLKTYGIKVKDGRVYIANQSPQLRKALSDTPWVPWGRTLGDYPGADNADGKTVYFAPGYVSKATSIPLDAFLREADADEPVVDYEPEKQEDIPW